MAHHLGCLGAYHTVCFLMLNSLILVVARSALLCSPVLTFDGADGGGYVLVFHDG